MKKTEARKEILKAELQKRTKMTIKDISYMLNVSEPTARRIASSFAEDRNVLRIHGGLRYVPGSDSEYSFDILEKEFVEEKEAIAKYASLMIKDKDIIFIDGGTTNQHLAFALAKRIQNNELKDLIIFTNSLINLVTLSPFCKVTVIGGEYRPKRKDFAGYISERILKDLSFNICFLGVDGISVDEGMMATDIETVRFDELLIKRSKKPIILSDSSKFDIISYVSFASVNDISMIITDDNLPISRQMEFKNRNVNLICVSKEIKQNFG